MLRFYGILFFIACFQSSFAQQDGPYKEYHDNGQLKVQGHYENKKSVGEWRKYHPNGQLAGVYSYTDGKLNKERIFYFDNGNVEWETKKEGNDYVSRFYYENGSLFVDRILTNGYYKEYLEDGVLTVEANYVDDELSGAWKKFYNSGELEWIVRYKSGYRDGPYQNFYKNGQLKLEGTMQKDKKHGEEVRYLEDGQLEWSGTYKNGRFDKNWKKFDASGAVLQTIKFDKGISKTRDYTEHLVSTNVPEGLLEVMPIYPGCENEISNSTRRKCMNTRISQFIISQYNVPQGMGLMGKFRIRVNFEIGTDGQVSKMKATGDHPSLEVEALRVLHFLPKIQPGIQRGKPVVVPYSIPIVINMQENRPNRRNN